MRILLLILIITLTNAYADDTNFASSKKETTAPSISLQSIVVTPPKPDIAAQKFSVSDGEYRIGIQDELDINILQPDKMTCPY